MASGERDRRSMARTKDPKPSRHFFSKLKIGANQRSIFSRQIFELATSVHSHSPHSASPIDDKRKHPREAQEGRLDESIRNEGSIHCLLDRIGFVIRVAVDSV